MAISNINAKSVNHITEMCVFDYQSQHPLHGCMFVESSFTSR